ncbi:LOW QUALITY PROTEIN: uncharacterized protein [Patagioenas fasciata]|uniref:LOW QUALITY PROTEIN: uncharacterized protein n=1 Tax=Patagioenas fasciata TaxID=372321 RepID=UPI0032E8A11B
MVIYVYLQSDCGEMVVDLFSQGTEPHREEMLNREMTRLCQETEQRKQEQREQEQSVSSWTSLFLAALQNSHFWAVAGGLVLLFGLCCWLCCWQGGKPSIALGVGRISAQCLLDLPESFMMMAKLVDELLCTCRKLSRNAFAPRPKPTIAVGNEPEGVSHCEDHAVYRLLVPSWPPREHSFHLQMDTVEAMPARKARLRVELECTCRREDMLCFLHRCKEDLRQNQSASLLDTLCTGNHPDIEKTTRWFQILVKAGPGLKTLLVSCCYSAEHTGHGDHADPSSVGTAAMPFLHSKSTSWGAGADTAEETLASRLVTETLLPAGQ